LQTAYNRIPVGFRKEKKTLGFHKRTIRFEKKGRIFSYDSDDTVDSGFSVEIEKSKWDVKVDKAMKKLKKIMGIEVPLST